ncbi:MAG: stage V sporulation protein SpoVM [Oscillospiraceae bacterium]|nr:stage V sporulation protein SpoVM [Oscillospiraceae bacterium]
MKMVVVKSPKLLAGLFRLIFNIRKEPEDDRY